MRNRPWGTGGTTKAVYKYDHERDQNRMGSCNWLPKDGDLCVCTQHAGDYFSDYFAVREQKLGGFKMVGKFGAYNFSEQCGTLSDKIFHLLQAGEVVVSLGLKGEKVAKGKKD